MSNTKAVGVDAIFFSVTDVPRAFAFYRALLDIRETSFETAEHGAEWILPDGTAFGVGKYASGEYKPSGCVLFKVENVESVAPRVPELGGKLIEGIRTFPNCKAQWCEDPDGNSFVLHQRTSQ
jgi:predicted enzyme related to lactoylglutathione lyase